MKTLPNNNFLFRRLQTNKTQTLHRLRLKPCPTKDRLPPYIQVRAKDVQPDNDVEILHDDLYALAWQSGFEHFVMPRNHNPTSEPTKIPIDIEDNSEYVARDVGQDILSENHPTEQEIQTEHNQNPEPSFPRKGKYNLRSNPLESGKANMLTTTQWLSSYMHKLFQGIRDMANSDFLLILSSTINSISLLLNY